MASAPRRWRSHSWLRSEKNPVSLTKTPYRARTQSE